MPPQKKRANKKENKNLKILDKKSLALFVKICSNADGQITINHELSSYGGTIGFTMRAKNDAQEYFITEAFYKLLVKKSYLFPIGE